MATWTNIPDSVLEPGKPARSVDALALRDNPIAIAEGAAGAPRIKGGAFDVASVRSWLGSQPAGGVGTYAIVGRNSSGTSNWNATVAGSQLRVTSVSEVGGPEYPKGNALSGTWRIMSYQTTTSPAGQLISVPALAIRIS